MPDISMVRASLLMRNAFFGHVALKHPITMTENVRTMGTDGEKIYCNPKFLDTLSLNEAIAVLAHECMHIILMHSVRKGTREHQKWNIAGDYALNPILAEAGFNLPANACIHPDYSGKTADEIYNLLPDQGEGEGNDDGSQDGSCPHGHGHVDEHGHSHGCGGVIDNPEMRDPAKAAKLERDLKRTLAEAAQVSRATRAGSIPGSLESLIDDILNPKIPWQQILRNFFELNAQDDYDWDKPSRRYLHQRVVMPRLYSNVIERIVIGIDTSGSVSDDMLQQVTSEIQTIRETCPIQEVVVIHCDYNVRHVEYFDRGDLEIINKFPGRGGTRFTPVFDYVEENSVSPTALIYMSDMECHYWPEQPDYPCLWVNVGDYDNEPPFGTYLQVKSD